MWDTYVGVRRTGDRVSACIVGRTVAVMADIPGLSGPVVLRLEGSSELALDRVCTLLASLCDELSHEQSIGHMISPPEAWMRKEGQA